MKDSIRKSLIIIIFVFGLCLSGVFIAAIWSDDIDAKSELRDWKKHCPDCGVFCGKWTEEGLTGAYQHKKDCVAPFDIRLMPEYVKRKD